MDPLRLPMHEMSYLEYTQQYEHESRSYYSLPAIRPKVSEKVFSYSDIQDEETRVAESNGLSNCIPMEVEEKPLNLICSKTLKCKPLENLMRPADLPLDLSTKS